MLRLNEKGRPIHPTSPARQPAATAAASTSHFPQPHRKNTALAASHPLRLSRYHSTHQGVCQVAWPSTTAMA